ncbi:hypothetical protein RN607_00565 [Demequina capsici]|uniref:Uncharacterized protein n=1 Tax=Demequina capsici TaxID=3075620 RepID=A0AA96JAM4_9MICO|nr:hypothetical protein [Demequina sp. PMTSA13]WNM27525.1 hypothetical protein RN607_00565 [Demequina sp. PMTSA13]
MTGVGDHADAEIRMQVEILVGDVYRSAGIERRWKDMSGFTKASIVRFAIDQHHLGHRALVLTHHNVEYRLDLSEIIPAPQENTP